MGRFLWLGLILLADFAFANKSTPPLQLIHQINFKELQICNSTCTPDYRVSDDGVRHVSFTCKLKECDTASTISTVDAL